MIFIPGGKVEGPYLTQGEPLNYNGSVYTNIGGGTKQTTLPMQHVTALHTPTKPTYGGKPVGLNHPLS